MGASRYHRDSSTKRELNETAGGVCRAPRTTSERVGTTSRKREAIQFFTIAEVAERLNVSTRTVRRWIDGSELVAHRLGGALRIAESDLRAFLALRRQA